MIHSSAFVISKLPSSKRAALRPLLQKCWAQTYTSELGEQTTARLIETLKSDDVGGLVPITDETAYIATQDDHILGCAVSAARHGIIYIWGCYILPDFQRKGIGKSLLKQSVSAHDRRDMVQLTVLTSSAGAIQFYQALGFRTQSEQGFELFPGYPLRSMTMTAMASILV